MLLKDKKKMSNITFRLAAMCSIALLKVLDLCRHPEHVPGSSLDTPSSPDPCGAKLSHLAHVVKMVLQFEDNLI